MSHGVRRTSRALFIASFLLAACDGPAALAPIAVDDDDQALAALEADTGHRWVVRRDPVLLTPAYLDGRTQPIAATPSDAERAALDFFTRYRALFHMRAPADELVAVASDGDELGMTHARFIQRIGHVPVLGSQLVAHFDVDGSLIHVNGRYVPVTAPASLVPRLSADEARVAAVVLARELRPLAQLDGISTRAADLVLVPVEERPVVDGSPRAVRLAWHTVADVVALDQPLQLDVLVDAADGAVLGSYDRNQYFVGSGLGVFGDRKPLVVAKKKTAYWLEDASRGHTPTRTFSARGRAALPGSELRSNDPTRWDEGGDGVPGAAVDAHAHVATAWDYFLREHGRAGWGEVAAGIRTSVHYGDRYPSAFFDGTQLVFGDGDDEMSPPSSALDLVAHEYAHGLITATAGLEPRGSSGAIAEGIADVFACLIEWSDGAGRWQIGDTVFHPDGEAGRPLRDLAHPHTTGQPEHMSELAASTGVVTPRERDSLHVDASIAGHLGYLLVEGDLAQGLAPLGARTVSRLFYRALVVYLFPRAGFAELADALLASADDLDPKLELPVASALIAVGLR